MDKELPFNVKIGNWLSSQTSLYEMDSFQENLVFLKGRIQDSDISEIDIDLICKIAEEMLILSIILEKNKTQSEALINYLTA